MPRTRDTAPRVAGLPMVRRPSTSAANPPSWWILLPEIRRKINVVGFRAKDGSLSWLWNVEVVGSERFNEFEGVTVNGQQKAANAAVRALTSHAEKVFKFAGRKPR